MWTSWREKSISGFEVCADCTIAVVTKAPGSLLIAKMARGFMKCQGVAFMYTYSTVLEKYGTDCKLENADWRTTSSQPFGTDCLSVPLIWTKAQTETGH